MGFQIVDLNSRPIKNVRVSIKELGYQTQVSGSDGKVYFENVPVGGIHYFVSADGYNGIDGTFNITTKTEDNNLRIKLAKIPVKEDNIILISGEVVNRSGKDISMAEVEVRAGNANRKVKTDESGSFNIEFNLDAIKYNVTEFILEVSKGDCKEKETFAIPQNNYLYKEIIFDCKDQSGGGGTVPICERQMGDWEIQLNGCERSGKSVVCDFTFKSNFRDRELRLVGSGNYPASKLYDDGGYEYTATQAILGNKQGYSDARKLIIANIPIKGSVHFSNISTEASEISLLDIGIRGDGITQERLQCRNIPIRD
jgi:hypothetical protein